MPEGVNPNIQSMQGGVVESFFNNLLDSKTPLLEKYRAYDLYNKGKEAELNRYDFEKIANYQSKIRWFAHVITSEYAVIEGINEEDTHIFKWIIKTPSSNPTASAKIQYTISESIYQSFDEALFSVITFKYSAVEENFLLMQSIGMKPNNYKTNISKGYIANEKTKYNSEKKQS